MSYQMSIFDGEQPFKIDKPIRLITLFSGYDSQALALKYLGVPFEHYRTCEWAIPSIQALHDQTRRVYDIEGCAPTQHTVGGGNLETKITGSDYKVRKLTERECFRLMGVKDEDFDKISPNQYKSKLYHLAGDSIVTTCLMALFGQMLDVDWEEKIREVTK